MKKIIACLAMLASTATATTAQSDLRFSEALVSSARSEEIAAEDDLYAPLLGDWEVDTRDLDEDGNWIMGHGEWLFRRTLEGRAFQDVWIMPARKPDGSRPTHPASRYGNTFRMYDRKRKQWRIVWFNPMSGAFNILYGRRDGDRIVHEGTEDDGSQLRWVFDRIEADCFHWYGERRLPGGPWHLEVEFSGRRAETEGCG